MTTHLKWTDFRRLDRERLVAAANGLLPGWVTLLLTAAIAWQLARIAWMLVPGSSLDEVINLDPGA